MLTSRRTFLAALAATANPAPSILVHEHVLVDFIGAGEIRPGRYDPDDVFRVARPKLEAIARHGCVRLLEATPNYLGRDPRLMRRLSDATGVDIWVNTGIYGAGKHRFVPAWARDASAGELARRWIEEARRGIDGIKPRFIKTGVTLPLSDLDRKLVRAAAIASRETGLPIASHTNSGPAALEQIEIVTAERVPASRYIWVHTHSEKDLAWHGKAARTGAWLEFDGLSPKSAGWHLACLENASANGFLAQSLLSHDAGWYRPGEPGGGNYRDYTFLYTGFAPSLKPGWFQTLLWDNPRRAYGE